MITGELKNKIDIEIVFYKENFCHLLGLQHVYKKNKMEFDVDSVIKENLEVDNEFVKDLVYGVVTSYDELGELANKYLKNWTIDRLDMTGASILRIALYEIKYMDTPDVVVINEAVELAKKYSDDDVKNMINAVLDKVIND